MSAKYFFFFCSFLFLFFPKKTNSAVFPNSEIEEKQSIFELMYRKDILEVDLFFNVEEVINNRRDENEHPAKMVFEDRKGNPLTWNIDVSIRGVYRRHQCAEMPPLKINFKKSELKKAGLSKFDDYKLVTHCVVDEEVARTLIFKEYLAYKYYNLLTDESFRVQLLQINYIDVKTNQTRHHFGFIIEDLALLRARIGATKVKKSYVVPIDSLNMFQYQTMAYFQYFIGNLDWGTNPLKNLKIVKKNGQFLAIPYDFDYCSLVSPPYAKVDEKSPLNFFKVRIFKGISDDAINLRLVSFQFYEQKYNLRKTTRRMRKLPRKERRKILKFIDRFFKEIDTIQVLRKSKK